MNKKIKTNSIDNENNKIFECKNINISQDNLNVNHSVIPTNDINQEKYIENSEMINYKKLKLIYQRIIINSEQDFFVN